MCILYEKRKNTVLQCTVLYSVEINYVFLFFFFLDLVPKTNGERYTIYYYSWMGIFLFFTLQAETFKFKVYRYSKLTKKKKNEKNE